MKDTNKYNDASEMKIESRDDTYTNKVMLERVDNGVILTDGEGRKYVYNVEDSMGNDSAEPIIYMLYAVLENLGYCNNKYQKENVEIRAIHGRGYECKDKACPICKEMK